MLLKASGIVLLTTGLSWLQVTIAGAENMKTLVSHRGASAYAPEHTLAAYELAITQGADYVEVDLQMTKDRVLVCLHDPTLERTTNVEDVFPERFREIVWEGHERRVWPVQDFELEEIRQLDAGSWFGSSFVEAGVPTFEEAIELIRGRCGLFPELKNPHLYEDCKPRFEQLFLKTLRSYELDQPGGNPNTPVIVQSFDETILKKLRNELNCRLPLIVLVSQEMGSEKLSTERLRTIRQYANGIGPSKHLLIHEPEIVERAHDNGLTVTPYTFNARHVLSGFDSVEAEMSYFLYQLGVDALFTDNPDLFPRSALP